MPFTGKAGDTLYLRDSNDRHLYVILTNPNSNDQVVLCNFTAATHWKETVVIFKPRRNKKLFRKPTTINYGDARLADVRKLLGIVAKDPEMRGVYCPADILADIIRGAFQSRLIPQKLIDELRQHYPDEYDNYYTP